MSTDRRIAAKAAVLAAAFFLASCSLLVPPQPSGADASDAGKPAPDADAKAVAVPSVPEAPKSAPPADKRKVFSGTGQFLNTAPSIFNVKVYDMHTLTRLTELRLIHLQISIMEVG